MSKLGGRVWRRWFLYFERVLFLEAPGGNGAVESARGPAQCQTLARRSGVALRLLGGEGGFERFEEIAVVRLDAGVETFHEFAVAAHEEFREVPADFAGER